MQIAGVGPIELSLASMGTGISAQQQVERASVGQNGLRSTAVSEKREAEQAKATKASADAADIVGTPDAGHARQSGADRAGLQSERVDAGEALTKRQLFDYLLEVERSGATDTASTSALVQSAIGALDGTLQKISATLEKAQTAHVTDAGGDRAQGTSPQTAEHPTASEGAVEGSDRFGDEAEQLLERSMSVMWAAANLEVVMSSVTAVTSSTSTLIKQQ